MAMQKLFLVVLLLFFVNACSASDTKQLANKTINRPSLESQSILDSPGLEAFKLTLNQIVKERYPEASQPQHFYVSKYPKSESMTYMFWQEKKLLWIMSLGGHDEESWLGVRYPSGGQLIDLNNNVVSSEDEVGSSSYLVTRAWASERLFDAVINGDLIIINK